ncbi:MAG TPA: glycosyltransferase family 39 protein [Dehalococcoidia bacterium]|nr:glycosyltransferase family 39 protein [Dehalococcoidia bacterium]
MPTVLTRRQHAAPARHPQLRVVGDEDDRADALAISSKLYAAAIAGAVALGFLVRAGFVLGSDFPLNDGGLFYQMVRDLQHAHYALPQTTTYNGDHLPFIYPPLGLYLSGLLNDETGMGLATVLRFVPLAVSTLTIGAFFLLAREVLRTRLAVIAAVFAFALVPRSFLWMIMGGGVTRAPGLLFALLTMYAAHAMYTRGGRRHAAAAAIFAGLALLSHIEMAWFAAFSCGLFFLAYGRSRRGVALSVAVVVGAVVMVSPWLALMVARHGVAPFGSAFVAAGGTSTNPVIVLIELRFTNELLFPMTMALGGLGAVACVAGRRYLLPGWPVAIALLDSRALGTDASVPLALLAGVAVADVLVPLAMRVPELSMAGGRGAAARAGERAAAGAAVAVLAGVVLYAFLTAMVSTPRQLSGLGADERAAMAWSAAHTPATGRFLIVSGDQWALDRTSEWFPVLAQRQSVVTTQGYEWQSGGRFRARLRAYDDAQKCASKDASCIAAWADATRIPFDYVYLPKLAPRVALIVDDEHECCAALRQSLRGDSGYAVVYDGPAATIFKRRS